jgi:hypothetical protein
MGAGQPGGARAHDGDLPTVGRRRFEGEIFAVAGGPVGHKGLEVFDIQGFIQMAPDAGPFAGVRAMGRRPREGLSDELPQGLQKRPDPGPYNWMSMPAGQAVWQGPAGAWGRPGRTVLLSVHPVFIREVLEEVRIELTWRPRWQDPLSLNRSQTLFNSSRYPQWLRRRQSHQQIPDMNEDWWQVGHWAPG